MPVGIEVEPLGQKLFEAFLQILLKKLFVYFIADLNVINLFFSQNFHQQIIFFRLFIMFFLDIFKHPRAVLKLGLGIGIDKFFLQFCQLLFQFGDVLVVVGLIDILFGGLQKLVDSFIVELLDILVYFLQFYIVYLLELHLQHYIVVI